MRGIRNIRFSTWCFPAGKKYDFVASRHKIEKPEDLKKAIILSAGEGLRTIVHKYTLDQEGLLNFYVDDRLEYSYRCMATVKPVGTKEQAGDIGLTGYTKKRSEISKLFRHWP